MMSPLLAILRWIGRQHWIPFGRDRILRLFCHPDRQRSHPFEIDFFGYRYPGDLANLIDWSVFFYGAYSYEELFVMRDIADGLRAQGRPVVVYDIGANIGHHTLFISRRSDRVISFEPFEAVRRKLEEKVVANRLTNVEVYPVALGAENGSFPFYPPTGANSGTGSLLPLSDAAPIEVPVRRGDDLVREDGLPAPTLVKIDVEGSEPAALAGLRDTLTAARPFVLMELFGPTRDRVIDEAGLRALLYPGAELFEIRATRGRRDYRLRRFDFGRTFEFLVAPPGAVQAIAALAARLED